MAQPNRSESPWPGRAVTGVAILLGAAFVAAGGGKLADPAAAAEGFARFGLPGWLAVVVGASEVAGGVGLCVPRLSAWAAAGLLVIMIGAAGSHLLNDPFSAALPALVMGGLCALVAVARRPQAMGRGAG